MFLPNAERATVAQEKLDDYLLNPAHPDNGGKANFFRSLGYTTGNSTALAAALRALSLTAEIVKSVETVHGTKYIIDGPLEASSGAIVTVRTVWIIDRGLALPRLVTAYPHEG